jgi:MFS family permease
VSRARLLAVGLFLAVTIAAFEATAVITSLPTIVDELDGRSLYGATLAANMLANLVAIVAAGEAADRRGPATPFAVCATSFVAGLLVAGAAPSMEFVVLGRVLQGGGVGGFSALAYVGVKRGFPDDRQARMYAVLSAGWVLPSLAAPFLAGAITDGIGWRWVFLGMALPAALVSVVVVGQLRHLPDVPPAPGPAAPSRVPAAVRLTVGAGIVLAGLPAANPMVVAAAIVIGGALAGPAITRLFPAGWYRARRGVPAVVACRMCATFAFLGVDSFVPLAADRVHRASATVQGVTIIGASLTWTGGQALSARWNGVVAPRRMISAGFGCLVAGALLVMPVVRAATPLWAVFLAWMVGGLGMGLLFNPTSVFAMSSTTEHEAGLAAGQINMADSLGFATVGGVGGAIVALSERGTLSLTTALLTTFSLAIGVALLGLLASRNVVR